MNKENILRVADAIANHSIPELGFNMGDFVAEHDRYGESSADRYGTSCGTVACIAGWTKRIRTGIPIAPTNYTEFDWEAEGAWLGLDRKQAKLLFYGDDETNERLSEITPDEAASVLRELAETGKVDWSIASPAA